MIESFMDQLVRTIESEGGSLRSIIINYYDGETQKQAVFSALEIRLNRRLSERDSLIEHRLGLAGVS